MMKYTLILCLMFGLSGCASLSPHMVAQCDELARMVDEQEIDRMKTIDGWMKDKRDFADRWISYVTIPTEIQKKMEDTEFCKSLKDPCKDRCKSSKFLQGYFEEFAADVIKLRISVASAIDGVEAEQRNRARIQFLQYRSVLNSLRAHLKTYLKTKQLRQELTKKMGVDTKKMEEDLDKASKKLDKYYEMEE